MCVTHDILTCLNHILYCGDFFIHLHYILIVAEQATVAAKKIPALQMEMHLLREPEGDGGFFHFCRNIVKKYGLVPRSCFGDTHNQKKNRKS